MTAVPPLGFFPVPFFIIPLQMWLTAGAESNKKALLTGLAFGVGYFFVGIHWMGIAFEKMYGDMPWLLPIAVLVIPLCCGLFFAVASLAAFPFRKHSVVYAVAYSAFFFWGEFFLGHKPFSFPWNLLGASWYHALYVLQSISVFGIYGLTFMTVLWATVPFLALRPGRSAQENIAISAIVASFLIVLVWGMIRVVQASPDLRHDVAVQILQPNVSLDEKNEENRLHNDAAFDRHLELMRKFPPLQASTTLFIWPEGVFNEVPSLLIDKHVSEIAGLLPEGGYAAVGVHRILPYKGRNEIYNSLFVINKAGQVLETYDKAQLVQWAEYLPLDDLIQKTPLKKYFDGIARLTAGPGPETIRAGNLPAFSPAICYEAAFSGALYPKDDRPDFLLFVSNDAWTDGTLHPLQDFSVSRLRAIEEGLPVLRSANTGLSAVLDPYGHEIFRLAINTTGVIRSWLPKSLPPTPFSLYGDKPSLVIIGLLTLILLLAGIKKDREDAAV